MTSETGSWAVWAKGFRPFFLCGAVVTVASMVLWLGSLLGHWQVGGRLGAVQWHSHEMLFGFTSAIIAGFLLTAVGNWTKSEVVGPVGLGLLVCLWLTGRVAVFLVDQVPLSLVMLLDVAFLPALAFTIARPLWQRRSWRNMMFVPILLLMATANALFYLGAMGLVGRWSARATMFMFHAILLLVSLIGGRILPLFTKNKLRSLGEEVPDTALPSRMWAGKAAGVCLLVGALAHMAGVHHFVWSVSLLLAGLLCAWRLLGWQSWQVWKVPMLWVLHLGYFCLSVGLVWKGVEGLRGSGGTAALHLLGVGCIGVMCLGMMSRVSLGHTGRTIEAHPFTTVSFFLLIAAVFARVIPAVWFVQWYAKGLLVAGLLWCAAFLLFLLYFGPILWKPRADGKLG